MCRFVPIFVFAVSSLALPPDARACSVLANPVLAGFPGVDAVGVPTDVVPIYRILNGGGAAIESLSLVSEAGDSVKLGMRGAIGANVEFLPDSALRPNTRYTLSVSWLPSSFEPDTLSFTTGSEPFAAASAPPQFSIESYQDLYWSCGFPSKPPTPRDLSCIALDDQKAYQFIVNDELILTTGSFVLSIPEDGCVELRQRYPNGALAETAEICRSAGPQYGLLNEDIGPTTCTGAGLMSAQGLVRDLIARSSATAGTSGDASSSTDAADGVTTAMPATDADVSTATANSGTTTSGQQSSSGSAEVTQASEPASSDSGGCSVSQSTTRRPALWIAFLALACASRVLRRHEEHRHDKRPSKGRA